VRGIADLDFGARLDVGDHVADIAGHKLLLHKKFRLLRLEDSDFLDVVGGVCRHQLDLVAGFDRALDDPRVNDDPAIGIKRRIKRQCPEAGISLSGRVGDAIDDGFQDFLDADSRLGTGKDGFFGRDGQNVLQLLFGGLDVGVRQVDFVDDRNEFQPLFFRKVDIGNRLSFDALCGIDNDESSLAGRERAGDLSRKNPRARDAPTG